MRLAYVPIVALLLALAVACGGGGGGGDGDGGTFLTAAITLTGSAGKRAELTVELARSAAERGRGLMFRESLAEERGMLFVFAQETKAGFWMKNTKTPLSIAFIDGEGTILEIQDMEALSEDLHRPAEPYRYALEVNQGWFERRGLGLGDRVEIPADVRAE